MRRPDEQPSTNSSVSILFLISGRLPPAQDIYFHLESLVLQIRLTSEIRHPVTAQMHEMELVHRRIYELEQQQLQIKAKYVQQHPPIHLNLRKAPDNDVDMMMRLRGCVMSWNPVVEVNLMLAVRLTLLLNHHQVSATAEAVYSEA